MSKVNVQGVIRNLKNKTSNVYTPVIEAIVNSIQSIIEKGIDDGKIEIVLHRERLLNFETTPDVISLDIIDNGIGFNQKNTDSFDTIYSDNKIDIGGKGFGRFMYPKYFNEVKVESVFKDETEKFYNRKFIFGSNLEIVANEKIDPCNSPNTYSKLSLIELKEKHNFDKTLDTISKKIVERIIIYFLDDEFKCPTIIIREADDENEYRVLNDFLTKTDEIVFVGEELLTLNKDEKTYEFLIKTLKIYFAGNQKSKIILAAHQREVTDTS